MTREEAITRLKNMVWLYGSVEREQNIEAIDMAIEALKADVARWSSWNKTFEQSGIADLISRADAIEALTEYYNYSERMCIEIKALIEDIPSAELTVQTPQTYGKSINPSNAEVVADYISRADAIEVVDRIKSTNNWQGAVIALLSALPSAEAVEVVRCKDCYHAEDDITHMFCVYFHHKVYEDDYCSNAVERREEREV